MGALCAIFSNPWNAPIPDVRPFVDITYGTRETANQCRNFLPHLWLGHLSQRLSCGEFFTRNMSDVEVVLRKRKLPSREPTSHISTLETF